MVLVTDDYNPMALLLKEFTAPQNQDRLLTHTVMNITILHCFILTTEKLLFSQTPVPVEIQL